MKKGFTLVELLVVVAILGVLAAVGIVSYNNYTYKTKLNSVKFQRSLIIKSINAELIKCSMGETLVMGDKLYCNWMNLSDWNNLFMNAVVEYSNYVLNMKNPFNPDQPFIEWSASIPNSDVYLGKVFFHNRNETETCIKTPCNDANNRIIETVNFEDLIN